jgi:hypothetical protein
MEELAPLEEEEEFKEMENKSANQLSLNAEI